MAGALPRILCVDDEPNILIALSRHLRSGFEVVTAIGGDRALDLLRTDQRFAAVLSDLRMPGHDGIAVLSYVRDKMPDTVRVLLTGQADLQAAIDVVNEGAVFRFLQKPCAPDVVIRTLQAAVQQHQLLTSERVLLEQTLRGAVRALVQLLGMASPPAVGRATRIQRFTVELTDLIGLRNWWELDVAALLSQVGCLTLPPDTVSRYYLGDDLDEPAREQVARLPHLAAQLIAEIPRMDGVREILEHHRTRFDGGPGARPSLIGHDLPLGARILKVALDYDELCSQGRRPAEAVRWLQAREGWYDPDLVRDLAKLQGVAEELEVLELRFGDVKDGMIFLADVRMTDGTLLVARGQEVTQYLLDRMHNYWGSDILDRRVRVTQPESGIPTT